MTRARGRPQQSDELDLRQRILDAAADEFAAAGYEGARMERIARAAGCNKALPYFYFKSKEGLFRAVLDEGAHRRSEQMQAQPRSLAEAMTYWFERNMGEPKRIRLVMQEALAPNSAKGDDGARREYLNEQLEAVRQFQSAGLLRSDLEPEFLLAGILALTSFPAAFPEVTTAALGTFDSAEMKRRWRSALEQFAQVLAP